MQIMNISNFSVHFSVIVISHDDLMKRAWRYISLDIGIVFALPLSSYVDLDELFI